VVRINSASVEELDKLDGVGPAIAQRIIDYRTENGGFKSVEEIKLVPGIGDKMFEKIKNEIQL
jgi:competence protein ComEA